MKHEKKKRVALVVFGLIVALLIVEGLLRVSGGGFQYLQERQNREATVSKDEQLDQTSDRRLNRAEGKEFVIVCIGESTTALGGENSWPRQLQRILNNTQKQKTFHVINKGLTGQNTNATLENLPGYLNTYKPDFVLAMVGINDGFAELSPEKPSSSQFRWTTLLSHLRTYGLIQWIAGGIKARITGNTEDVTTANAVGEGGNSQSMFSKSAIFGLRDKNNPHLYPQTISNLNSMVNLTVEQGIKFVFVQYALRKTDILKNVIENKNVIYISNYKVFINLLAHYDYEDLFWDDFAGNFGHATTFGNRVIADNVAQQLLELLESQ